MNDELKIEIYSYIPQYIEIAESKFKRNFKIPTVGYSLKGRVAGMAYCNFNHIELNPVLLTNNKEYFIEQTIPHEIAHILDWEVYRGRGHNKTWKSIMTNVFELPPNRCHNLDISVTKKEGTAYMYKCNCMIHTITKIRHTRYLKPDNTSRLRCNNCKSNLIFLGVK